jgi:SAM-dependent methyltransferase
MLNDIAMQYPEILREAQLNDVNRMAFNIGLIVERKGSTSCIADIGGGVGLFSVGCAAMGMKVTLVDDFLDDVNKRLGDSVLDIHKRYGVTVVCRDALDSELSLEPSSLDVVTSFHSIEHWHASPRPLFRMLRRALREDGLFVLCGPNCVNLKKRLTVPFGYGKWSPLNEWYSEGVFRGHVRELDVGDLRHIARDLELRDVEIIGRNWMGIGSRKALIRIGARAVDPLLRLTPGLCSDLYLIGRV